MSHLFYFPKVKPLKNLISYDKIQKEKTKNKGEKTCI